MSAEQPTYVVISPVRNEAAHLGELAECMARQTVRAARWIVVDDGSNDGTAEVLAGLAREHDWLEVVVRADRGFRKSGTGVMEAFAEGLARLTDVGWDYLVKLDGDVSFAEDYFARCFAHFDGDPELGIAGGSVCVRRNGQLVPEYTTDPPFHVRGATKIYRRACWEAIGGLIGTTGWDTWDEVKANRLGWRTRTLQEIPIAHHRHTGGADGDLRNLFKNGRANHICGYHPLFMLAKMVRRLKNRPLVIGGITLWLGYATGAWRRIPRVDDPETISYLRDQQIRRLAGRSSLWG
ncbi:glycosyltransferase [bacterium]|nr:glycosyltransferase [bacterium]